MNDMNNKMELTLSWDDTDVSKVYYGEIWTNGETKFVDFNEDKGVNEHFITTPHLVEFRKDFVPYCDTGSEKFHFRIGKFSTQSGVNVAWKVPRDHDAFSDPEPPWILTGTPTTLGSAGTGNRSWDDRIPDCILDAIGVDNLIIPVIAMRYSYT